MYTSAHITYDVHVSMDTVAVGVWVCLKAAVKGEALLAIICFEGWQGPVEHLALHSLLGSARILFISDINIHDFF